MVTGGHRRRGRRAAERGAAGGGRGEADAHLQVSAGVLGCGMSQIATSPSNVGFTWIYNVACLRWPCCPCISGTLLLNHKDVPVSSSTGSLVPCQPTHLPHHHAPFTVSHNSQLTHAGTAPSSTACLTPARSASVWLRGWATGGTWCWLWCPGTSCLRVSAWREVQNTKGMVV